MILASIRVGLVAHPEPAHDVGQDLQGSVEQPAEDNHLSIIGSFISKDNHLSVKNNVCIHHKEDLRLST